MYRTTVVNITTVVFWNAVNRSQCSKRIANLKKILRDHRSVFIHLYNVMWGVMFHHAPRNSYLHHTSAIRFDFLWSVWYILRVYLVELALAITLWKQEGGSESKLNRIQNPERESHRIEKANCSVILKYINPLRAALVQYFRPASRILMSTKLI